MAAMVSPWAKPGAWALDSEEHEAQLLQDQKQADVSLDFPSLNDSLATKQKKKGQTISLAEFNTYGGTRPSAQSSVPQGLTHVDFMILPTGPRQRTAEELDRNKLGGGFRNYGSNGSYDRNTRYSEGEDSSNSKWGSSRGFDENRRNNGGSNRDSGKDFAPSRADEVDNWASTKKPVARNGFERRDRGGFLDSPSSKADESESWVSNKSNMPLDGRRSGTNGGFNRERRGGFTMSGGSADSDDWGRKKEESNGGSVSDRPKLNLQPRTLPVSNGNSELPGTVTRSKSSNPFGEARPREDVLAEKGHDWKKIDEQLESRIKELPVEKAETSSGTSFGKKSVGNGFGNGRAPEDRTERSWRKPGSPDARPGSVEVNQKVYDEGNEDGA